MTDTLDPEEEARWAAAAKLADGVPDDGLKKRRRRVFAGIALLVVVTWVIGFVLAFLVLPGDGTNGSTSSDSAAPRLIAQLVFLALGLLVGVVGFVWARRTGHYITRWRAVASPLNRKEKKGVRRQIAGKREEVNLRRLPIILAIAHQSRRATLGILPIYSAFVFLMLSTVFASDPLVTRLLVLASLLLFIIAAVQLSIAYRRAGAFIETNSSSAPSTLR